MFGLVQLPDLVEPNRPLHDVLTDVHRGLAWTLIVLLTLHVAAALYHGLVRRDGVVRAMAPWPLRGP